MLRLSISVFKKDKKRLAEVYNTNGIDNKSLSLTYITFVLTCDDTDYTVININRRTKSIEILITHLEFNF